MTDAAIPQPKTRQLPLIQTAGYSIGQVAGQVFRDLPSLLLLIFLTNVVGIEPGIAGATIFFPKLIVGVFSDFIVGGLSEKSPRSWPKWLLAGAVLAPIAIALLFRVPAGSDTLKIVFVIAAFSFYMSVYSVFSVPYLAIASKLASTPHERTVLMAWRVAFTSIGVLLASGGAPFIISRLGGGQPAFEALGLILAVICCGALSIAYFGVRDAPSFSAAGIAAAGSETAPPATSEIFPFRAFRRALSNRRFAILISANILQLTAGGMAYAAFLYFLIYNMQRQDAFEVIGLLTIITCVSIIMAQPVWVQLARRFGKKNIFLGATFLHCGVALLFGMMNAGVSFYAFFGLMFMLGVANSGWTLLGYSLMSDIASEQDGGVYSAVWIAVDKIGFALGGTLLIGLVLSAFGFSAANAVAGMPQSDTAMIGIAAAFGFIPAAMLAMAGAIFTIFGRD